MKLSIDIDDAELNEVISKGIKDLSTKTITDLAKEAISSYLQTDKGINSVIYQGVRNSWDTPSLRPEFVKMLENSFEKEEVEAYRAKIFKAMEEKGGNLIVQVLAEVFSRMLLTEMTRQDIAMAISRAARGEN